MRSWMIFYVIGVISAMALPSNRMRLVCISVALVCLLLLLFLFYIKRVAPRFAVFGHDLSRLHPLLMAKGCLAYVIGFAWVLFYFSFLQAHHLPKTVGKSDWQLSGQIQNLFKDEYGGYRFDLIVAQASQQTPVDSHVPPVAANLHKIKMAWYAKRPSKNTPVVEALPVLEEGGELKVSARLRPLHGSYNPHSFDYERWLWEKGYGASGYVLAFEAYTPPRYCLVSCVRSWISRYIGERYGDSSENHDLNQMVGLLSALVVGDASILDDESWALLKATGTVHVAVISGMHIGFAASFGMVLALFFIRMLAVAGVVMPSRGAAAYTALTAAVAYFLVSGMGLPAQRALVMVVCFCLCQSRFWYIDLSTRFWLSVAIVLTLSPFALYAPGFWLSFLAVATLLSCLHARRGIKAVVQMQWRMSLVLAPLTFLFFDQVPWLSILVNLWAVPLVALILLLFIGDSLFALLSLDVLQPMVSFFVQLFWSGLSVFTPPFQWGDTVIPDFPQPMLLSWQLYLVLVGVVVLCLPRAFPLRGLVSCLALGVLVLFSTPSKPVKAVSEWAEGEPEVWILDVGQGLAIYGREASKNLLFDTGTKSFSGFIPVESALEGLLKKYHVTSLDVLVLSHNDLDHVGGAAYIEQRYPAKQVYMGEMSRTSSLPSSLRQKAQLCGRQSWAWQHLSFRFLNQARESGPRPDNKSPVSVNDQSCILQVQLGSCRILLPGDISKAAEARLVFREQGRLKQTDVLVAAHHGSNTSSSSLFLEALQPEVIVYSAGFLNRFNHPHPKVVARASALGIRQMNTAHQGAVRIRRAKKGGCDVKAFRELVPRIWHEHVMFE